MLPVLPPPHELTITTERKRAKRTVCIRSFARGRPTKHIPKINGTVVASNRPANRCVSTWDCAALAVGAVTVRVEVTEFAPGVTDELDIEQVGTGLGPDTTQLS